MIYLKDLNIAYMAVPKAACTSVKAALAVLDTGSDVNDPSELDHNAVHHHFPTRRFRPHRWAESEGAWRFTVVRDPLKRALSVYSNRVVDMRELHNSPRLRQLGTLPLDPDPDFFFQNIESYKANASTIKHHTIPMWLFTGKNRAQYDRVYTTSDLSALADALSERAGAPVVFPRRNRSSLPLKLEDLSPATRAALQVLTAPDYEIFGDLFPTPF